MEVFFVNVLFEPSWYSGNMNLLNILRHHKLLANYDENDRVVLKIDLYWNIKIKFHTLLSIILLASIKQFYSLYPNILLGKAFLLFFVQLSNTR